MNHLYCRLAVTNLKNNRRFYLPYILMGMFSAMMFYSMRAIQGNAGIAAMRGAGVLGIVLTMGVVIVGVCVFIFLFYTNSFVMKRRRKELGVYNILGMEKKHIAKVMAWEAVILYAVSVGGGLIGGIVFNKLLTMFLYKLTGLSETIPFYVSGWGCLQTAELFGAVYILMLLYNFMQVKLANPVALLHGGNVGEREPKANWVFALLGAACIAAGYYLAATAQDVVKAVNMFFAAVVLVIAGTYGLFMAVSIAFLKLLKKNKNYYYKTSHFITVSGMLYRMKRNAVGLANICVLSTMVLVMVSTTVCLYAGVEDSLDKGFEKEVTLSVYFKGVPDAAVRVGVLEQLETAAEKQGRKLTDVSDYVDVMFVIRMEENMVEIYDKEGYDFTEMGALYAMTAADYEKLTGRELGELSRGSVAVAAPFDFEWDAIDIFGQEYHVAGQTECPDTVDAITDLLGSTNVLYVIVADDGELDGIRNVESQYHVAAEVDGTREEKLAYAAAAREALDAYRAQSGYSISLLDSRTEQRGEYLKMNGGFLFLGLFLGSMFLMITVLIIYYKQISEGYEDRERFAIMTKVGMDRSEVKAAINTQVRTVFFMPIVVAAVHLAAAFPLLKQIMAVFGLSNTPLFIRCLIGTGAVFGVIYFVVFRRTSAGYYKIVYQ